MVLAPFLQCKVHPNDRPERVLNKSYHFSGDAKIIKPAGKVVFQLINKEKHG